MSGFQPKPLSQYYIKKTKSNDNRLGDLLCYNYDQAAVILASYPDDEGILNNNGRLGANLGPQKIKEAFYKMTTSALNQKAWPQIYDMGDISLNFDLEQRHELVATQVEKSLDQGKLWLGLGGGHDYAFADGMGFLKACQKQKLKPVIINFDAHLDVRPEEKNKLNSGTPFYRLLNQNLEFDFYQLGIQTHCNSLEHWQWCEQKGATIVTMEEAQLNGKGFFQTSFDALAENLTQQRPCFISIDIDGFSSSEAMGCSQSWVSGFKYNEFLPLFHILIKKLNVICLGVYEVSPPLDFDNNTSKLAAKILHHFLNHGIK